MEHPDIIILDEPINAIDRNGVVQVRNILEELKEEKKIMIIACHDAEEMNLSADEIFEMETGTIVNRMKFLFSSYSCCDRNYLFYKLRYFIKSSWNDMILNK